MEKLGTYKWVQSTGGVLSLKDKMTMVAQGVYSSIQTKKRISSGIKFRHLNLDQILPPDSAIAKEAALICEEVSESYLFYHCLRSYYWSRLLSDPSLKFDDEVVFVSFMLHDLGLCEDYRHRDKSQQCFTIHGAKKAEELACKHGWSDKRTNLAANAITLHLNVKVDDIHGREAQMVRLGAGADVAGLGLEQLYMDQIDEVVQLFPRNNLKEQFLQNLKQEILESPCCRVAFMQRKLGFRKLIRNSLFSE